MKPNEQTNAKANSSTGKKSQIIIIIINHNLFIYFLKEIQTK